MKKPLLVEIGVEELPAIPFLQELPNIEKKWHTILKEYALSTDFTFFYTPRRLIFWHREFPLKQEDRVEALYGAPLEIAYKEGEPTGAALGFAKKCGVDVSELQTQFKNGKEVLFFQKEIPGKRAVKLLEEMLASLLSNLHFGKSMRWKRGQESFIRPIRWIGCMLGKEVVNLSLYGICAKTESYGHRTLSYAPFSYHDTGDFFCQLLKNGVILDPKERKENILSQFKQLEKSLNLSIEIDIELLAEVVAITENPHALIGSFDEAFLRLPDEVIITSMKEHQRYFAVYDDGKLTNKFVVVSNAITEDYSEIIRGNEKVLHARLSDGLFFYENDLREGLQREGLKQITFMQGAGSIYDKTLREAVIGTYLGEKYAIKDAALLEKTILYTKADLLTDMVYEFTELQGLMGYYYALAAGEDEKLALALKEQYLPDGEDSSLPSSDFSAVVAMSYKLDSLFTLFSLGKIPTGTKDPFALRRAAVGVIKIVVDRGFSFDIKKDIESLSIYYEGLDIEVLEAFFIERMLQYLHVNPSLMQAVLQTGERDIVRIYEKVTALEKIVGESDFKAYASTFKRVANIVKDMDIKSDTKIDASLLVEKAEKELYSAFQEVDSHKLEKYHDKLQRLFTLKEPIDHFFDAVMVNVEDEALRNNRKNMILKIYLAFREIADIKEITV